MIDIVLHVFRFTQNHLLLRLGISMSMGCIVDPREARPNHTPQAHIRLRMYRDRTHIRSILYHNMT